MRAETVINALRKARTNNLPPDKPGAVFIKVPQSWLEEKVTRLGMYATVREFLRNTKRVVTVVIYAVVLKELKEEKMMLMRHRFREFETRPIDLIGAGIGCCSVTTRCRRKGWHAAEVAQDFLEGIFNADQIGRHLLKHVRRISEA